MDFFALIKLIAELVASEQREEEYRQRFRRTITQLNELESAMSYLAALVNAAPQQAVHANARGLLEASAQLLLEDEWFNLNESVRIDRLRLADVDTNRAIGILTGNPDDEMVLSGLYTLGLSLRLHVIRKLGTIGPPYQSAEDQAFFQDLLPRLFRQYADGLETRLVQIEFGWDRRRRIEPTPPIVGTVNAGSSTYYRDGQQLGGTPAFSFDATPLLSDIRTERVAEVYRIHPLYLPVIAWRRAAGSLRLVRHPDAHSVFYVHQTDAGPRSIHWVVSQEAFTRWFVWEDVAVTTNIPDLPVGAPVSIGDSPSLAAALIWDREDRGTNRYLYDFAARGDYPIAPLAPQRPLPGPLYVAPNMAHVWWLNSGFISHVSSQAVLHDLFPGVPIERVGYNILEQYPIGPSVT